MMDRIVSAVFDKAGCYADQPPNRTSNPFNTLMILAASTSMGVLASASVFGALGAAFSRGSQAPISSAASSKCR